MEQIEYTYKNSLYRFALTPNSSNIEAERAFNLYGMLIIPTLLSGILLYNIFQLRGEYFMALYLTAVLVLFNIYFFYRKTIDKKNTLQLIINGQYIQIWNGDEVVMKENIHDINIKILECGKEPYTAIRISSESFYDIVISAKNQKETMRYDVKSKLTNPDYWLRQPFEWNTCYQLFKEAQSKNSILV